MRDVVVSRFQSAMFKVDSFLREKEETLGLKVALKQPATPKVEYVTPTADAGSLHVEMAWANWRC